MSKILWLGVVAFALIGCYSWRTLTLKPLSPLGPPEPIWSIRSIDTMKNSRDLARAKDGDASFDDQIDLQVKNIATTGATHVALATPYDDEFVPFLTRWVAAARKYHLHVWFRGNFSGWEGWFDYPRLSRSDHLTLLPKFILNNPTLFEDGDIFTPCPECENGGPGDPRVTGDIIGHRQFLIDETTAAKSAFAQLGKQVIVGYHSMNYDVALAIMDKPTTEALGGVVAIDHYVSSPAKMIADIDVLKNSSGGQIFLGELGAPIPDLNGTMTEDEQADWLRRTLDLLILHHSVVGLNYWVNTGGSTEIWSSTGLPRRAVSVLSSYFTRLVVQ